MEDQLKKRLRSATLESRERVDIDGVVWLRQRSGWAKQFSWVDDKASAFRWNDLGPLHDDEIRIDPSLLQECRARLTAFVVELLAGLAGPSLAMSCRRDGKPYEFTMAIPPRGARVDMWRPVETSLRAFLRS